MNIFEIRRDQLGLTTLGKLALLLVVSLILWVVGAPILLNHAKADNLTQISDTLSQSGPSQLAVHVVQFNTPSTISPGATIKLGFDENTAGGSSSFAEVGAAATSTDIYLSTSTSPTTYPVNTSEYAIVASCTSGNQATVAASYNNGTDENLTFTICGASPTSINAGTFVDITVGTSTQLITNPPSTGSPYIDVYSGSNFGETRVAIVNNVTLTASVNTTFTFTVTGVATGTEIGAGDFTTGSTTAIALPFATLSSSPNASSSLAQTLAVSTNASNGFSVTVQENQPPTSATGQLIYLFNNGASSTLPILWASPNSTIGVSSTYGHLGFTSDDSDLLGVNNQYANATKWAGDLYEPHVVFSNPGPSDGVTQNVGKAHVDYKIQIGPLQAAATDYTNTLWYVATPTF